MQQIGFQIKTEFMPSKDDPVRLLLEVTEGLDYTNLYNTYSTIARFKSERLENCIDDSFNVSTKIKTSKSGYKSTVTIYKC